MNSQSIQFSSTAKFLVTVAALAITLFFISEARNMINAIALAAIIVVSSTPLLYGMKRRGIHPLIAYTVTLIIILVVFVAIVVFVLVALANFIESVPAYREELDILFNSIQEALEGLGLVDRSNLESLLALIDPGRLLIFVVNFFAGLIGGLSDVFLVALIVIFLLVDAIDVPEKLSPYLRHGDPIVTRVFSFGADIRRYIVVTTIVGLVTGFFDTILFIIMGVDFPVLWGALAFFMSYIPTIGFWLALIPPVFLALLESGPAAAVIVFLGIVIINGFAENVVKPKYMGDELDLSPFTVVFSVVFWSALLGPFGAILSVPMTMAFKSLILAPDPSNRWMADLLSARVHGENEDDLLEEENGDESALNKEE